MPLTIISGNECLLHDMDEHHPEQPSRISAINDQLIASGMEFVVRQKDSTPAIIEDLYLAHGKDYVDTIIANAPESGHVWLDEDTLMMEGSLTAALHAAGAARDAVNMVMEGDSRQVFCAVRPPGHHAEKDKAMGFCIFNNIAVAAYHAVERLGLERVAIVDFDVHHGNGTEDICAGDDRIHLFSSFQHPFYPYSGASPKGSNIHNVPLAAGGTGMDFRQSVIHWLDEIADLKPQLILVSAGFDAHLEDDLGQLQWVEADYYWISKALRELADTHCEGRIVSMLEGGYEHSALGRSVISHLKGLMGQ